MKSPRPSRAAGWISMPVKKRERCDTQRELVGHTGGGDRRPAAVRLKPRLGEAAPVHAQVEAREIAAAVVLLAAGAVGIAHQAGVPRVEEVLDQRRAVSHAAGTGIALRTL